jgi:hypothetical protein
MKRPFGLFMAFAFIGITLAFADHLSRKFLGQSHWRWYLEDGPLLSLMSSLVTIGWPEGRDELALISANPARYIGAWQQLVGWTMNDIGTCLLSSPQSVPGPPPRRSLLEVLLACAFVLAMIPVLIGWTIMVLPAQYVMFLICGAPARMFATTERMAIRRFVDEELQTKEVLRSEKVPEGWTASTLREHPQAITSAFAALVIYLAGKLVQHWAVGGSL